MADDGHRFTVSFRKTWSRNPSLFGERALAKRHLAVAERDVDESRQRLLLQRSEVARLEGSGRGGSLTMRVARELLQTMKDELMANLAVRDRLRHQLKLPRTGFGAPPSDRSAAPTLRLTN